MSFAFISYQLLKPVKRLALATERVASSDLSREIPVLSGDELGKPTRSFNQMIHSLSTIQNELVASEKLISMGRLSAGVAHEIRNPLNAMQGAISVLRRRHGDDALVMEQVFINLIINAVHAMDADGILSITTSMDSALEGQELLFSDGWDGDSINNSVVWIPSPSKSPAPPTLPFRMGTD